MQEDPFFQEESDQKENFLGMSRVEIGVLVGLALVILILGLMIAGSFIKGLLSPKVIETPIPTFTLAPSLTPKVTSTPWPAIGLIPDWSKFEFAESRASLWLPNSYQGGDPIMYPEIVMMTVETFSTDSYFYQSVEEMLSENPAITLFAFDTAATEGARIVYVIPETVSDPMLTMDDYLGAFMETARLEGARVVGREMVDLDYFNAGKVTMDLRLPTGDESQYANVRLAVYLVQVDDTVWQIAYRTPRDEFDDYLSIIEASINTFHVRP